MLVSVPYINNAVPDKVNKQILNQTKYNTRYANKQMKGKRPSFYLQKLTKIFFLQDMIKVDANTNINKSLCKHQQGSSV